MLLGRIVLYLWSVAEDDTHLSPPDTHYFMQATAEVLTAVFINQ
jgi:hypothetical protein